MPSKARPYRGMLPEERHADRRRRLLEAALDIAGREGAAAMTITAVCRRAKVATTAFYEHFAGQDELLQAAYDDAIAANLVAVQQAIVDADDVIEAAVRAGVLDLCSDARVARLVLIESVGVAPAFERRRARVAREYAALLGGGADPRRDGGLAGAAALGALLQLQTHWLQSGAKPSMLPAVVDEAVRAVRAILR